MKRLEINPRYSIDRSGQLYAPPSKRSKDGMLRGLVKKDGYKAYWIMNDSTYNGGRWYYAHRLVAMAYIPNPDGLTDVNHIDGDKLNNCVSNLEWVTHSENVRKSYATGQRKAVRGKDHWKTGTVASDDTKVLMSERKVGENHPKYSGYYLIGGVKYHSAKEAGVVLGCSGKTVLRMRDRGDIVFVRV